MLEHLLPIVQVLLMEINKPLVLLSLVAGTSYLGGKIAYIFQSGDAGYVAGETHGFIIMNHSMGMQAAYGGYNASTGYFSYTGTSNEFWNRKG